MDIITWAVSLIYKGLSNSFDTAVAAFRSIGLEWAAVVGGIAVLSMALRSFFAVFVGDAMNVSTARLRDDMAVAARGGKYAKKNGKRPHERYHGKFERRGRNRGNSANLIEADGAAPARSGWIIGNKGYRSKY